MDRKKAKEKDKAAAAKASVAASLAESKAEQRRDLKRKEEISELEKRIAADQARLQQLINPPVEFPKMVKDKTFASRAEQDAAGPEYADK